MTDDIKRIARLIEKYLKNWLSEDEDIELQKWRNQSESNKRYFTDTVNEDKLLRDLANYDDYEQDKDQEQRKLMRPYSKVVPSQAFPWRSLVGTAAMLVMIGSAVILWGRLSHKKTLIRPLARITNDVAPVGKKAVLTLANGSQLVLDNAGMGSLARQGNVKVIKLYSGEIAYRHTGSRSGESVYNTVITPRGGQYKVTLSDGTEVWLNAASSIRFPTAFPSTVREVEMTGEVYFEVKHRPNQPFRVHTRKYVIEDLGTHFDVSAYADEPVVRTTLLEGSVETGGMLLKESGEQIVIESATGNTMLRKNVDLEEAVGWKDGLLVFNNVDFEVVLRALARFYDVQFHYEGSANINQISRFSGQLSANISLGQNINILRTSGYNVTLEGRAIVVLPGNLSKMNH